MKLPIKVNLTIKPLGERHTVTGATFALMVGMLLMAREDPNLWEVELFKTLLTAVAITGWLNLVLSFHYAANKGDEAKTENTARAFEAIRAAATSSSGEVQPVEVVNRPDEPIPTRAAE